MSLLTVTPPNVVVFRARLSRSAVRTLVLVPLLLVGTIVAGLVSKSGTEHLGAMAAVVGAFVAAIVMYPTAIAATTSRPHRWDLAAGTISFAGDTFRFADIGRVVLCTGAKGWRGVLFCTTDGRRVPNLAANVRGSLKAPMGRDQWLAVRALLASPHAPTLEEFGPVRVGPKDIERRPSKVVRRGVDAVRWVDEQIGWIDSGGDPSSRYAPVERFR